MLMRLYPYRSFDLDTPLSPDEALSRIAKVTGPEKWFRGLWPGGADEPIFEGKVEGRSFEIQRVIYYRNSFLPKIRGTIQSSSDGSSVAITMRLHPFPLIFTMFWLGAVGLVACGSVLVVIAVVLTMIFPLSRPKLTGSDLGWSLMPIGMFLFGVLLTSGCFAYEAKKAEDELLRVFEGRLRLTS